MKIAVYGICKNEAKFADRWMDSMGEADEVVVLDTGSEDDTPEQLRKRGAQVTEAKLHPWRFDRGRNMALSLVSPDVDICVSTDLDEVFVPGWRKALEAAWKDGTGQARYRYTWSFQEDGREGVVFWQEKIHRRHGYAWVHPVHEVLRWVGEGTGGPWIYVPELWLQHRPDPEKSRAQYLPLLELAVQEQPEDDRCVHYLGREYLYRGQWEQCIKTLMHHLSMPSAQWADERAASMRYIAMACLQKGERERAKGWLFRAIAEAPHLREAFVSLGELLYEEGCWEGVLYATGCALQIRQRPLSYISEARAWGSLPHDLRSIALYHLGAVEQALEEAKEALALSPQEARLKENVALLRRLWEKKKDGKEGEASLPSEPR